MNFVRGNVETLARMPSWVARAGGHSIENLAFFKRLAEPPASCVGAQRGPQCLFAGPARRRGLCGLDRADRAGRGLRAAAHLPRPGDLPEPAGEVLRAGTLWGSTFARPKTSERSLMKRQLKITQSRA